VFGPALEAGATRLIGVTADLPSFGAFIKLLQRNNDVNVLSSPNLLITNNQEGEISIGQRLPFPTGFLASSGSTLLGAQTGSGPGGVSPAVSVQREDVSLRMKLTPSVNQRNLIRLDVDVEVSDLAAANFNGLGPATSKRTAKTAVFCQDQQTVVIGGLMADRMTESATKNPILGDIPILGFLFRRNLKQSQRSNVVVALTPYVITDVSDLRRVAERKIRERREFVERFASPREGRAKLPDPEIDYRHTRGMLEQIHRAARAIDQEDGERRRLRERELPEESLPIPLADPTAKVGGARSSSARKVPPGTWGSS
jgi:general secretion pathway protein D